MQSIVKIVNFILHLYSVRRTIVSHQSPDIKAGFKAYFNI